MAQQQQQNGEFANTHLVGEPTFQIPENNSRRRKRVKNTFKCMSNECDTPHDIKDFLYIQEEDCSVPTSKPVLRCSTCRHDLNGVWRNISKTDFDKWGEEQPTKRFHIYGGTGIKSK